jgi:nucleoside-diphosphate-sugar epimerase
MDNNLNNKKILITGANGFIGQNFVRFIIEKYNYKLILIDKCFDNLPIYKEDRIELIKHNIEEPFNGNIFFDVDVAIHLAAIVGESVCSKDIGRAYKVNALGTFNLIQKINKKRLEKFVLLSSSNIYSLLNNMPVSELGLLNCESIYSTSKLASESIVIKYFKETSVSYYICRVSNIYGPEHKVHTIINYILEQYNNRKSLRIFSPNDKRDFVFIDDVLNGIIKLIKEKIEAGIYNIGGNEVVKIIDIVNICSELTGFNPKVITDPKPGNILFLDTRKIKEYGWEPKVSIKEGLTICLNKNRRK